MMLGVSDFSFRYGAGAPMGPWTLRVNASERVGVAGTSGSGKTSMLDLLAGLHPEALEILTGRIHREGRIAYVSQEATNSLSPYLSALDQVGAFCGDERVAEASLRLLGLDSARLQSSFPCQLSGGERQRVQVAQSLAMRPDFILADEPTANLDSETAESVLNAFAGWSAGLLIASHREEVFERLGCGTIVRLNAAENCGEWPVLQTPGDVVTDLKGLRSVHKRRDFWMRERSTDWALEDASFQIRAGEMVALGGPSGSGKTTLARCIAGAMQRRAQIVPQEPSGSLNPRQLLSDVFHEANPEVDGRIALASVGLQAAWISRRASELSEGQRARVAIARALAALPSAGLLILDESLAGLDAATERTVLRAIAAEQRRRGLACLIITHAPGFPVHRNLTMRDGRLIP
jgi:peptide/nickel transport system ATP-binding protein